MDIEVFLSWLTFAQHPAPSQTIDRTMTSSDTSRRRRKQNSASASSGTRQTADTTVTKETGTSGAYNRNFAQHLIDHGIYPDGYEYPDGRPVPLPDDWEEFNEALLEERASLSPSQFSEEKFRDFRRADAAVVNEGDAMRKIVPFIQGTKWDERRVQRNVVFGNLAPLTDGTLKNAKPDLYYGGRPEQLQRDIRQDLREFVVPSTADNLPIAPTMFLEAKGPDGSLAVAQRQACYDGALGARGMHELASYQQTEHSFDNSIKAISSIYHGGQLKLYTHHMAQPDGPGTRPEYYMNQVRAYAMTDNLDSLKSGLTGFRNSVDWADKRREVAISQANARFNRDASEEAEDEETEGTGIEEQEAPYSTEHLQTSFMTPSQASATCFSSHTDGVTQDESETSTDELAAAALVPAKRRTRSRCRSESKRRAGASSGSAGPRRRFGYCLDDFAPLDK